MGLDTDGVTIAGHAERVLPLANASLSDDYRYQSLPLCVIDAVFSIAINYSTVRGVVARYCAYTGQQRVRPGVELPSYNDQESMSNFCNRPEQADVDDMASRVYGSRHRTSPRSGVLKSEAVLHFARCLQSHGIEYLQDVPSIADNQQFEVDIRGIKGQNSGVSLRYFWMLAGSVEFIKPDRMILRYLEGVLFRPVKVGEALPLLQAACVHLAKLYPSLSPRLLDYEIWKHQQAVGKAQQSEARGQRCKRSSTPISEKKM
jgi:hypothetical protein